MTLLLKIHKLTGVRFRAVMHTSTYIMSVVGSTDCVCYATVGVIDHVTSALHIIIGEEAFPLKKTPQSFTWSSDFELLISHNALQETLSLWMCVQFTMPLLWCATRCLWWATASMGTFWLRVKNTAGWDLSDTTFQVWTDDSAREQKWLRAELH